MSIANRRRFDEMLENEWKRTQRAGTPLSIIMVDIDFFKHYNDHYGHGVGDICLKNVAVALADTTDRPYDLVARYGGEEFAAILPETDVNGAHLIAERFRRHVEALHIPHEYSSTADHVTISVGLASVVPQSEMTPEELLKLADNMLYQAKKNGRNRVCMQTIDNA
ncbi:hypothetical protein CCP3SC15_510004 [Gammaproteobacteria bacterium]